MTVAAAESRLRVLVVDDDADTIESTALLFQMQGHEAKTARDGAAAIEQTKAFCPHLILLDIAMPKMDGFQILRALRGIECAAESTIVAVTGYANRADRRRCAEAGFDLHFRSRWISAYWSNSCGLRINRADCERHPVNSRLDRPMRSWT